jgi:hypothetical protein
LTAFTDKYPDTGLVDLGYHATPLNLTEGAVTVSQAAVTLTTNGENIALTANLNLGSGSDGVQLGTEYLEVNVGGVFFFLPSAGAQGGGSQWTYTNAGGASATVTVQGGSVNLVLQASGLPVETLLSSTTSVALRVGDDFGATAVPLQGTLQYP